jgi:hypothetical protein
MFNLVNATLYQKFVIPIKGLGRQRAEEQIGQLIQDYSEEVEWDDSLGTLRINGQKHLSYNKQYWFPEGDGGTPNMEIMNAGAGHNLNEDDILKWFFNILKRASKIPMQRFQDENGGGNVFADAAEITRDESKFGNFVMRLRSNFKELMVKPLKLQMLVEFPELKDDERFMNEVDIQFLSNQLFEEWKKLGNLSKKAEILGTLNGIQKADGQPYFHIEYLIDHVLKLTPEEKEENKKYWLKDGAGAGGAEGVEGGGMEAGGEMGDAQAAPEGGAQTTPEAPAGGETEAGGESGGGEAGGDEFEF